MKSKFFISCRLIVQKYPHPRPNSVRFLSNPVLPCWLRKTESKRKAISTHCGPYQGSLSHVIHSKRRSSVLLEGSVLMLQTVCVYTFLEAKREKLSSLKVRKIVNEFHSTRNTLYMS